MSLKTYFSQAEQKYWTITTTQKVGSYGQTRSLGVVADSAETAIIKVTQKYKEATVVSCNYKGAIDIE